MCKLRQLWRDIRKGLLLFMLFQSREERKNYFTTRRGRSESQCYLKLIRLNCVNNNMDPNTKNFLSNQLMWIVISLGISFAISWFLPFPVSLVAIIGTFLAINFYMRRYQLRRMGAGGFGGSFLGGAGNSSQVNYACISCGQRHNQGSCPRCGSRMKRAEF